MSKTCMKYHFGIVFPLHEYIRLYDCMKYCYLYIIRKMALIEYHI